MKLSIIIVSWNTRELVLKCLKSIFEYLTPDFFSKGEGEVFLMDNHSADGTREAVEAYKNENGLDNLCIVANQANLGFAKANNQAIQLSRGEYILLLNPDTELIDGSLTKLVEFLDGHKEGGIVGPRLLHTDRSLQKSCRRFPNFWDQFLVLLKTHNFLSNWGPIKKYYMQDFKYDRVAEVDQVMGAAMLVRRQVFDQIGLLDEKFWAIFEEVDFCRRAKDAGWQIYFYPHTQIIHHKSQSFAQRKTLQKQINFNRSLFYYFKKHKPFYQLFFLWLLQPTSLLLALVDQLVGIKRRVGKNRDV